MASSGPVRVGILGYGFAGRGFHAYLLTHEPRLQLAAVASRDPERRARAEADYPVRTFETLEQMLDGGEVDLVILATPHNVHADQAVTVMDAGRHCVTDKVMCLTTADADRMIAARDRNGVFLGVFHNRRWDGDFLTVRRVLEQELLGTPWLFDIGLWRYGPPRSWRARRASLGTIMHDWGAHFIDQLLLLAPGKVCTVAARARYGWAELDIESYLCAELSFDSGVYGRVELSNQSRLSRPHWIVLGEAGGLEKAGVDPQEAAMLAGDIRAAKEPPGQYARLVTHLDGLTHESRVTTLPGDWTEYYRNVADVLLEDAKPAVLPEEARRGVRVLEAIEQAIITGETVRFEEPA